VKRRRTEAAHLARVRRAHCLASFWEGDRFVAVNYLSGKETVLSPLVAALIGELDRYVAMPVIKRRLAALPRGTSVLKRLVAQDVLVVEGSRLDVTDRQVAVSWEWGPSARDSFTSPRSAFDMTRTRSTVVHGWPRMLAGFPRRRRTRRPAATRFHSMAAFLGRRVNSGTCCAREGRFDDSPVLP
jgi:hypothetical protein